MKIRVSDIKVKNRIRKDLGDLQPLKESIQKLGLLHPILIDLENTLISGERRLESVKILGWEYVDVRIVDIRTKRKSSDGSGGKQYPSRIYFGRTRKSQRIIEEILLYYRLWKNFRMDFRFAGLVEAIFSKKIINLCLRFENACLIVF